MGGRMDILDVSPASWDREACAQCAQCCQCSQSSPWPSVPTPLAHFHTAHCPLPTSPEKAEMPEMAEIIDRYMTSNRFPNQYLNQSDRSPSRFHTHTVIRYCHTCHTLTNGE